MVDRSRGRSSLRWWWWWWWSSECIVERIAE